MKTVQVNLTINLEDDPSDSDVVSPSELEEMLDSLKDFVVNENFPFVVEDVTGDIKVK
jgi:hypothetical protein